MDQKQVRGGEHHEPDEKCSLRDATSRERVKDSETQEREDATSHRCQSESGGQELIRRWGERVRKLIADGAEQRFRRNPRRLADGGASDDDNCECKDSDAPCRCLAQDASEPERGKKRQRKVSNEKELA